MKQGYWGFVAGMMFMAAVAVFAIWGMTPRVAIGRGDSGTIAVDLRDC